MRARQLRDLTDAELKELEDVVARLHSAKKRETR